MKAEGAEEPEKDAAAQAYPPETYRYMSWSAVQFVHRPTWRPLAWICCGLVAFVGGTAALVPFAKVDLRVPAAGEIQADPGVLAVLASIDGRMDFPRVKPGTTVAKGQILGMLELDLPEDRLTRLMSGLERNTSFLDTADRDALRGSFLENGAEAESLHDPGIRDTAMSLDIAVRQLRTTLQKEEPWDGHRTDAMQLSRRLRGELSEFLERHRLRAPAPGILLQFEAPPHGAVKAGQPVAIVLPEKARLVAVLSVEPRNAAKLAAGQAVRHKLEAYPFQQYGLFEGEVLSIEQVVDAQRGLLYAVRTTIRPAPYLPKRLANDIPLMTGMKSDSSIVVGKRRLFDEALEAFFNR
ncbi:MAG: HlyD family efflux transporter periplasmic adaptor subunit [Elusimicrobiota bacterium]